MSKINKKILEDFRACLMDFPPKTRGVILGRFEKAINNSQEELLEEFSEDLRFLNISGDQHMEIQRLIKKYKSPTADKK